MTERNLSGTKPPISTPNLLKSTAESIGHLVEQYKMLTGATVLSKMEVDIFHLEIDVRK